MRDRRILALLAGIFAVGVMHRGFAAITLQRVRYEDMPLTRIAELAIPDGVHFPSLFLFAGGCSMARFMRYEWARTRARDCFSGCCLIAIQLATGSDESGLLRIVRSGSLDSVLKPFAKLAWLLDAGPDCSVGLAS